jgi:pre-mRNA-splicing factor SPF27
LTNLALLEGFGKNAWLVGNSQLEDVLRDLERELARTKQETESVNKSRKAEQEAIEGELDVLEEGWRRGIGRVVEAEIAAEELRREILRRRREGAA